MPLPENLPKDIAEDIAKGLAEGLPVELPSGLMESLAPGPNLYLAGFFGLVGMSYFVYGKKQKNMVALFAGVGLMIYPYFVYGLTAIILMGLGLMAAPFILK